MELGKYFLSIEKQISELVDGSSSNDIDNNDCLDRSGTILQQAAYDRRAYDSYNQARRFQPLDGNIKKSH